HPSGSRHTRAARAGRGGAGLVRSRRVGGARGRAAPRHGDPGRVRRQRPRLSRAVPRARGGGARRGSGPRVADARARCATARALRHTRAARGAPSRRRLGRGRARGGARGARHGRPSASHHRRAPRRRGVAPRRRSPRDDRGRDREVLGLGGRAPGRVRGPAPTRRDRRRRRLPAAPLLSLVEADRADARVGHAAARASRRGSGAMTDIVLGPVLSLYSVAFYRRVARQRLGRGLAYLVYLSSLYSAAISIALLAFWLPAADRFVDWLAPNLPEVKLTDHG